VLNPAAGGAERADPVGAAFEEAGGDRVRRTSGSGDARAFAREAVREGGRHLVVAGGDGTLREAIEGIRDADVDDTVCVGVVPLGTGNDLARSLDLPDEPEDALVLAMAPSRGDPHTRRTVDLLRVRLDGGEPRWALNAVIVGEGGAVGEALEPEVKERWGPLSYLRGAVEVALDLRPVRMAVTLPEEGTREARILNVVAANGRYAGGGIPIAPGARPDDGELDVVVIDALSLRELVALLPPLLAGDRGEHPDDPAWHHTRTDRVEVAALGDGNDLPVSIDGENVRARRVQVALETGAVCIVAPGPSGSD
jgi:diacylglycerol kinase (ATP)